MVKPSKIWLKILFLFTPERHLSRNKRQIPIVDVPNLEYIWIALLIFQHLCHLSSQFTPSGDTLVGGVLSEVLSGWWNLFIFLVLEFVSEEKRGKLSPGESRQLCCECNQQILRGFSNHPKPMGPKIQRWIFGDPKRRMVQEQTESQGWWLLAGTSILQHMYIRCINYMELLHSSKLT